MEVKNTFRLYNTLSREIEDFVPVFDKKVGIYTCGPTVYDHTHIGHIRKFIFDDVLVRLLRYLNYDVKHVMNITDVGHLVSDADTGEDKLEKGAKREGKTAWEVAKIYEEDFFRTMSAVNVKRPDIVCRATEHIADQITLIQKLEENGFTYLIADGVYFDSTKSNSYGKLAGIDPQKQLAGVRIETVPGKKHATDFALWKFTPSGTRRHMEWDSPWGRGFPGWHIECSAMSLKYLGNAYVSGKINGEQSQTIDIHTGGIDHIPIHHTNEIAQSEAVTKKQFVKYWIHHNFLLVEGKKMSKSLNNFLTIDDLIKKGFDPLALRFLLLQTHYRQESNFTWEALIGAQTVYNQLKSQMAVIKQQKDKGERATLSEEKLEKVNSLRKEFKDTIRMDLNTPQAVAILWKTVKSNIPAGDKFEIVQIFNEVLGLGLDSYILPIEEAIPPEVNRLFDQRKKLRLENKFNEADNVRKQIEELGFVIVDLEDTSFVKKRQYFVKTGSI